MGYQVDCSGNTPPSPNPFLATQITSVLGEARKAGAQSVGPFPAPVVRFHKGVDITNFCGSPGGETVYPIEAGTVIACLDIGTPEEGIRVQGQHIFDYIHVNISTTICDSAGNIVNASVFPTASIGTIIPLGTNGQSSHLHLDQLETIGGVLYDINPETNGLDFSDTDSPQWDSITVGNVDASLIPVDAGSGQPLILDPQIVSPPTFIWPASQPPVGVYVTGRDGSLRKGLYSVSIAVSNFASPPFTPYSNILQFDDLNDLNSAAGVDVVYLQRNVNSDTWQGTSLWGSLATTSLGLGQAQASPIDLTNAASYPDGSYNLCATLTALQAPGSPSSCDDYHRPHAARLDRVRRLGAPDRDGDLHEDAVHFG